MENTLKTGLLNELQYETFLTRRMLELVPFEKATWKPHLKSMTLQELSQHIAMIPVWISKILTTDELDLQTTVKTDFLTNDENGNDDTSLFTDSTEALLNLFDRNMQRAVKQIEEVSEDYLMQNWTNRDGEKIFFQLPRLIAIRNMAQNHNVHHRAQLGVYLRLLDIPLPTVYGSSADFKV